MEIKNRVTKAQRAEAMSNIENGVEFVILHYSDKRGETVVSVKPNLGLVIIEDYECNPADSLVEFIDDLKVSVNERYTEITTESERAEHRVCKEHIDFIQNCKCFDFLFSWHSLLREKFPEYYKNHKEYVDEFLQKVDQSIKILKKKEDYFKSFENTIIGTERMLNDLESMIAV